MRASRPSSDRDELMVRYGRTTARMLTAGDGGDPEAYTGWRGHLQLAADHSRQDAEILRIADEIYELAPMLTTGAALLLYVETTRESVSGPRATRFLEGMLEQLGPRRVPGRSTDRRA